MERRSQARCFPPAVRSENWVSDSIRFVRKEEGQMSAFRLFGRMASVGERDQFVRRRVMLVGVESVMFLIALRCFSVVCRSAMEHA